VPAAWQKDILKWWFCHRRVEYRLLQLDDPEPEANKIMLVE
jgi:hypothetical protein